ncbi:hypothetical protein BDV38DRAFT_215267 [Aspergillus pseudotamarii]|uniref:Uncharacterized protein n=1 Tax=Aspergillus pseudotamarii TaxID=132259 RepID=A0A5N6SC25_ASPPS|nr:uncharacterized protein BDV38DRAFT_215267 [Aspergillus pseudotamarii]KAE8132262.1 hypothetical protein BDV38DRAFT_215267 [Aspergillus pseudotamarii]
MLHERAARINRRQPQCGSSTTLKGSGMELSTAAVNLFYIHDKPLVIDSSPGLPLFFPSLPFRLLPNLIYIVALPQLSEYRIISFKLQTPLFFPVILDSTLKSHCGIRHPRFSAHRPEDNHYRLDSFTFGKEFNSNVQPKSTVPIAYTGIISLKLQHIYAQSQRNQYQRHIYSSAPLK